MIAGIAPAIRCIGYRADGVLTRARAAWQNVAFAVLTHVKQEEIP
jgi:hypothetical protein